MSIGTQQRYPDKMTLYEQECSRERMYFVSSDFQVFLANEIKSSNSIHRTYQVDPDGLLPPFYIRGIFPNPPTRI